MNVKEKYKGMTFAAASEKISSKYKNRDNDAIAMRGFEQEMNDLYKLQEQYRLKEQMKDVFNKVDLKGTKEVNNNLPQGDTGIDLTKLVTDPELTFLTREPQQFYVDQMTTPALKLPTLPTNSLNTQTVSTNTTSNSSQYKGVTPLLKTKIDSVKQLNYTKPKIEITTLKDDKKESKFEEFLKRPQSAAILGITGETLGKFSMLASGREKYDAITNPYKQEALDLMRNQKINSQAIQNKILEGREAALANTDNIRSTAVQQAAQQNIFSETAGKMSEVEVQAQAARNTLSDKMASALTQIGGQEMGAQERARQLNMQSLATQQQSIQNMFESVGALGQEISDFKAGIATNQFVAKLIGTGNFKVNADCIEDYQKGKSISSNCIEAIADDKTGSSTGVDRKESFPTNTEPEKK